MAALLAVAGLGALLGAAIVTTALVTNNNNQAKTSPATVVIDVRTGATADAERAEARAASRAEYRSRDLTLDSDFDDPRAPPEVDPRREINVPTRGVPPRYEQIGFLSSGEHSDIQVNNIIPLYGRRTYQGSGNWNYYTKTQAGVKIPLTADGRDCSDDVPGCRELYDDDSVSIPALEGDYAVKLYKIGAPRYIPFV